ncbi:MAG: hypothetical protein ABI720_13680 [Actinomycetes bacterium]
MTTVESLIGIYRADGGIRGELTYLVGKVRGTAHCGLCDITHSRVRRKGVWDAMVAGLGVPFELLHLNERSAHLMAAVGDRSPIILAQVREPGASLLRLVLAMDENQVEASKGSVESFERALRQSLSATGLSLPRESRVTRGR